MRKGGWLAFFAAALVFAQDEKDLKAARETIKASDLQKQLVKVCSEFKGRKSEAEGEKLTVEYIAAEFKKYGLKEAGTKGYLQDFSDSKNKGTGYNAIGYIEGSDEKLRDTCVAISAHLDAVGGVGADDNGSGLVGLLELARALGGLKSRPKRSVLFVACGSEELWMVGSYHYVKNTTRFSMTQTIVDVNIDMIGRNDRGDGLTISGCESAEPKLNDLVQKRAKKSGVAVTLEDPMISPPGDNMPFYENGVPFLYFYTHGYGKMHPDYHQKTDTPNKVDYLTYEKVTRLAFDIIVDLANLEQAPRKVDGYQFPHPLQGKPKKK